MTVEDRKYLWNTYNRLMIAIKERDGFHCRWCFSQKGLQMHHKIPKRFGGDGDPSNLITLCNKCHKKAERRFWRMFGVMPSRIRFRFKIFKFRQSFAREFNLTKVLWL